MSKIKDTFFGGAEKKAGKIQERAAETSVQQQAAELAESKRRFEIGRGDLQPFIDAGTTALGQQVALLGDTGQAPGLEGAIDQRRALTGVAGQQEQQAAFNQLQESPGQKFLRERAEKALVRNASAIGGLGGGNVRTALQEQAIGFAGGDLQNQINRLQFGIGAEQSEFQDQINRFATLAGTGQQTGQAGAQLGGQLSAQAQQSVAQQSQTRQLGAAARGSGIIGQAQVIKDRGNDLAQAAGQFSDIRLKENINKIGELSSGLNWYTWDWTEEGKLLATDQMTEGVIAQEAAEKFPEAIGEHNGFMTVNYGAIH